MSGPITWRSLMQDSQINAITNAMNSVQRSVGSAFDNLQQAYQGRAAFDAYQANETQEGIKQGYLDALAGAKTPEELAALQSSGQLKTFRDRLTAANAASVRGAEDARLTGIRQGIVAEQVFGDAQRARTEQPLIDKIKSKFARGDVAGGLADLDSVELQNEAPLFALGEQVRLAAQEQAWKNKDRTYTEEQRARQTTLDKLTIEAKQREAQVAKNQAELATEVASAVQAHRQNVDSQYKAIADLAKMNNWPLDANGRLDVSSMDANQRSAYNAVAAQTRAIQQRPPMPGEPAAVAKLRQAGSVALPSLEELQAVDTNAGVQLFDRLAKSGKYSPAFLEAQRSNILASLDSSAPAPVGSQAAAIKKATAMQDVVHENIAQSNVYVPRSKGASENLDKLVDYVKTVVPTKTDGIRQHRDVGPMVAKLNDWATTGITIAKKGEVIDGVRLTEDVTVMPSYGDGIAAIEKAKGGWFSPEERADSMDKELLKMYRGSRRIELIREAQQTKQYELARQVRERLNPANLLADKPKGK